MKFSPFVMAGFLILLVILPDFSLSECVFGPENINQLIKRNKTILGIMNTTLFNYTRAADEMFAKSVPKLEIWNYLQAKHSVTPNNYLDFVSMGKLLDADWSKICSIPCQMQVAAMYTVFVTPLHFKLQDLAVDYSFSLGIFRPKEIQFKFMGTKNASSMDNSTLDAKCMAGSQFLWRISTTSNYSYQVNDTQSLQFATFATMLERDFERLYRRNTSALNKEFVRANVIHVKEVDKRCIAFMETYFLNSTHQADEIARLTSINELQEVPIFKNGFTMIVNINSTLITDYLPNSTTYDMRLTTLATQTKVSSTSDSTTILQTGSPTIDPKLLLPSSNAATPAFSSVSTEESMIATTSTTLTVPNYTNPSANTFSANLLTSLAPDLPTLINSRVVSEFTSQVSQTDSITNLTTSLPETISTSLSSALCSSLNSTLHPETNSTSLYQPPANSINLQSISPSSALDSSLNTFSTDNSTISFSKLESTTFSSFQMNYTSNASLSPTAQSNMSNSSQTNQSSEKTVSLTSSASNTSLLLASSSTTLSEPFSPILSTENTGTTEKTNTFDPDPFFKPTVPVIPKVYNVGLITPVTQEAAFLSITIPVAAGIILAIISCLFCLQVDWLGQRRKKEENAGF